MDLIERKRVILYLRNYVNLGSFMKRTISNADKSCQSICDGIIENVPTVAAIPVEWIENYISKTNDTDGYAVAEMLSDWEAEHDKID